jgi:glycolate oxidase iron-sulfur subunit
MKAEAVRDLEKCVKCGTCKAMCPTYGADLTEGMSARGRLILLRSLVRGELPPSHLLRERITSCLLCGMCETACPVGLDITEAIYQGRAELPPGDRQGRAVRKAAGFLLKHPGLGYRAARRVKGLVPYLRKKGALPFEVQMAEEPLRNGVQVFKPEKKKGRIALFTGCSINYLMPSLGDSLIHLLMGAGYEVVLPAGEVCCGAPLRALGLEEDAAKLARKNMRVFEKLQAEAVLSLCPTCTLALKKHYPNLIGRGVMKTPVRKPVEGPVAYHDPCHLADGLGVTKEPREILKAMGLELVETGERSCCGFSLAATHKEMSEGLLEERKKEFEGAETLVTACPGCMMQLGRSHGNVVHIIQLLDDAVNPEDSTRGTLSPLCIPLGEWS